MAAPEVLHLSAFTDVPEGGNPAGVVLDAAGLDAAQMQAIAARLGYSESAFVTVRRDGDYDIRYFSPEAEVPFCGHATIATGVALAQRDGAGELLLHTRSGPVALSTTPRTATLTSVAASSRDADPDDVAQALALLRWDAADLDPQLPPRIAYAGAHHLILAAATRDRLARLDYDFDGLKAFMLERDLTTVALVHREAPDRFAARNPFPVGGVVEDPATGAAAAALGAYLRDLGAVTPPATLHIAQGDDMGRPSRLTVDLDAGRDEVRVTGAAVALTPPS